MADKPKTEIPAAEEKESPVVVTGGLSLTTQPAGAVVQVDDQEPQTSPFVLERTVGRAASGHGFQRRISGMEG